KSSRHPRDSFTVMVVVSATGINNKNPFGEYHLKLNFRSATDRSYVLFCNAD
ncbi:hypothetical protein Tco_0123628, partial [Tanacetum coccineum]